MQQEIKITVLAKTATENLAANHISSGLYIFFDDDKYNWKQGTFYINPINIGKYNQLLRSGICFFYNKPDNFSPEFIVTAVKNAFEAKTKTAALLVKYQIPPDKNLRHDGFVYSCIIPGTFIKAKHFKSSSEDYAEIIYHIVREYLLSPYSNNLKVLQDGHPNPPKFSPVPQDIIRQSGMILPHIGNLQHLRRCLHNMQYCSDLPNKIRICFDDHGYKKAATVLPSNLPQVNIFKNEPLHSGPYPFRHYAILENEEEFQFFCDSDDISLQNRFSVLLHELLEKNLDLIGSHELRVDEFLQKIELYRFPLNVNEATNAGSVHPLLHPTSMIRRSAFIKTGGFSTDLKFGYDSQFTLRANVNLKIANSDNFLYIRFKRPNSLTTTAQTGVGSHVRNIQFWRWLFDYSLIKKGELDMEYSSLAVRKHKFRYRLVPA